MLRYRAASLLVLFFLLAPALHGRLQGLRWQLVDGVLVLFASYVVATCLNDVFDYEVDRVNHPGAKERPLVTGAASPRRLVVMAVVLALLSIVLAALIGPLAAGGGAEDNRLLVAARGVAMSGSPFRRGAKLIVTGRRSMGDERTSIFDCEIEENGAVRMRARLSVHLASEEGENG